jgi:hypothetical protein
MARTGASPGIVHHWRNRNDLHTFKQDIEVFLFLASVINAVPFNFGTF